MMDVGRPSLAGNPSSYFGKKEMEKIDTKRRNFLKWLALGVGALGVFILGKILGPSIGLFSRSQKIDADSQFKNFRVTEDDNELKLYNRAGDEIFIIEKEKKE